MRVMKIHQKICVAALGLVCMTATLLAAPLPTPKKKGKKAEASKVADQQAKKATDQQVSKQDDNSALKKQLADQQAEINQLLGMVQKLTERLDAQAAVPATTATQASAKPIGEFPSGKQVASLSSALPVGAVTAKSGSGSDMSPILLPTAANAPQPAPPEEEKLGPLAHEQVKLGVTFFGSFSHYTDAGFSPAFQDTPTIQLPPPGNSGLNAFEVNRAYVNLFYTPDEHVTLRITPDIYRQADNSYAFRLKYAYVDLQKVFGNGAFEKDKLTFGQTQNPLVDWEEGLTGYRFVYLMPWNYVSLSSTYSGIKLHGPVEFNGKEYLDYDLGIFNTASFHSLETNDKKQVMGRLTWYPFGTKADRTGFGVTVFDDYGYNTKLPSQVSTPLNRLAVFAHYQTHDKAYELVGEYDLGHNAASESNLFSGTGLPAAGGTYGAFSAAANAAMSGVHTRQEGFAFMGNARLGKSPFSAFGLFQRFKPNTNFNPSTIGLTDNPVDFQRFVAGVKYSVTSHFDMAFGDENFHWLHAQGLVTGGNTNGIVAWTQFNY